MLNYCFRRVLLIFLIVASALISKAQQTHFVYLQTENGNPFYVRMNNKVVSSSPAGYVILPNMEDGDYQIVIGFPKNEFPEEGFKISIDKKNEGFLLKNFDEKGMALFNLQSLALLPGTNSTVAVATVPSTVAPAAKKQDDAFSTMLADVVKDSSILQKNEPVVLPNDAVSSKEVVGAVADSPTKRNIDSTATPVENAAVAKVADVVQVVGANAPITKILGINGNEGMQMIYVDKSTNDTVRVFMPAEVVQSTDVAIGQNTKATVEKVDSAAITAKTEPPVPTDSFKLSTTPAVPKPADSDMVTIVEDTLKIYKESPKKDANALSGKDSSLATGNMSKASHATAPAKNSKEDKNGPTITLLPKVVTSSKVNSDCKAFATTEDFLRLRKKMASENSNDGMVQVAKKVFRTKCFSTEQIRNLSFLFLTDEGKYMFFDAAYAFTSDSDQYQLLKSQLKDDYYIKRFDAMIHN
jgi:hypothetical protein